MIRTLVDADEAPDEEGLVGERPALGQLLVQLRVGQGDLVGHVLVQHQREHGKHGVDRGVPAGGGGGGGGELVFICARSKRPS